LLSNTGSDGNDLALLDGYFPRESRGAATIDDLTILNYEIKHNCAPFVARYQLSAFSSQPEKKMF
jgi:hypothetical protein